MVQIGMLIKNERKNQNITQEDLCDGICEVSTLSKIENGRQEPNLSTFTCLMQRLGLPSDRYRCLVSRDDFEIQDLIYEIKRHHVANRYDKVKELLTKLEQYADPKDRIVKQYIMFIWATVHSKEDPSESTARTVMDELTKALHITKPKIDLEELNRELLSIQELEVLNAIANTYYKINETELALDIFLQLLKYLQKHCIKLEDIGKMMPMVTYNYSRILGLTERYQDSLKICEMGLEYCREYGRTLLVGPLLCNKGCALCELGRKPEGIKVFQECYFVQKALNREEDAETLVRCAWEKYAIRFGL